MPVSCGLIGLLELVDELVVGEGSGVLYPHEVTVIKAVLDGVPFMVFGGEPDEEDLGWVCLELALVSSGDEPDLDVLTAKLEDLEQYLSVVERQMIKGFKDDLEARLDSAVNGLSWRERQVMWGRLPLLRVVLVLCLTARLRRCPAAGGAKPSRLRLVRGGTPRPEPTPIMELANRELRLVEPA